MATIKVSQYDYTHAKLGQPARAKRMGTREYIESVRGWPIEGTEIEIDASMVDAAGKTKVLTE
jgi:hypothetical protein